MTEPALEIDVRSRLAELLEEESERPNRTLPEDINVPARFWQKALFQPLREASGRPGKEVRGRLTELAWQLGGGRGPAPAALAGSVEALHLGSLIVDDIEDGSSRRRDGAALHLRVGLPLALNAGNWLYFWPSVLLSQAGFPPELTSALRVAMDRAVLRCHYGQALDLSVRVTELRQHEVREVVFGTTRLKTGSLMELSAELGGLAAEAPPERVNALARIGRDIGIGLQMLDDLTGITSERRCHKGHEDLVDARPTWPWAWLAESADDVSYARMRALEESVARRDLHPELVAEPLRELVGETGRAAIRERLDSALATCRETFGGARGIVELERELLRLERYDG